MKYLFFILFFVFSYLQAGDVIQKKSSVLDTRHHLEWQDTEEIQEYEAKWAMSKKHCASLGIGDNHDWRLPTNDELTTLAKDPKTKAVFRNLDGQIFWTSQEDEKDDLNAYEVFIGNGHLSTEDKCESNVAICVRTTYEKH